MFGMSIVRVFALPYWSYHVFVLIFGFFLYVMDALLMKYYIEKNAPEFASDEEFYPGGPQKWELTAGLGIVPKWVSFIGIVGIGFMLASPLEFGRFLLNWLNLI